MEEEARAKPIAASPAHGRLAVIEAETGEVALRHAGVGALGRVEGSYGLFVHTWPVDVWKLVELAQEVRLHDETIWISLNQYVDRGAEAVDVSCDALLSVNAIGKGATLAVNAGKCALVVVGPIEDSHIFPSTLVKADHLVAVQTEALVEGGRNRVVQLDRVLLTQTKLIFRCSSGLSRHSGR